MGYVKSDLMVPEALSVEHLATANAAGVVWAAEVNAAVHSEICAVPAERLVIEAPLFRALPSLRARIGKLLVRKVDRLSCVRFGSARYSVPPATSESRWRSASPTARCGSSSWVRSWPPIASSTLVRRR